MRKEPLASVRGAYEPEPLAVEEPSESQLGRVVRNDDRLLDAPTSTRFDGKEWQW